jgi:hypothetical protein
VCWCAIIKKYSENCFDVGIIVVDMLIPKWEQTPYGYGESPNAKFFVSLPLSIRGLPIWLRGLCFRHPFSHALKNIFFAEASQFSCAHRANIPYHHHTSIAVAVASR